MAQDLAGLQTELRAMKGEILAAIAEFRTEIRSELAALDQKVQYLCDNLLGDADRKELQRVASRR